MKTKRFFSAIAMAFGVLALVATTSCKKDDPTSSELTLSKSSVTVEVGKAGVSVTAKYGSEDVTAKAVWTSADESIATVKAGLITAVKKGNTTVTCTYESKKVDLPVTVTGGSSVDTRLDGSNYILINMSDTQAEIIKSKIDADLRVNGEYGEGGAIVPTGADCVCQIWNPSAEIGQWPNVGTNSFGTSDAWFGTMSNTPLQEGWWGNICGGNLLTNLNNKYDLIKKITSDHVFCIALKGKYTSAKPMEIGMKMNGTEKWFLKITENTGEDLDGSWGIYTKPASDIFDFSQAITADEFFTLMFKATGSGATVDIDAAFFYIPAK